MGSHAGVATRSSISLLLWVLSAASAKGSCPDATDSSHAPSPVPGEYIVTLSTPAAHLFVRDIKKFDEAGLRVRELGDASAFVVSDASITKLLDGQRTPHDTKSQVALELLENRLAVRITSMALKQGLVVTDFEQDSFGHLAEGPGSDTMPNDFNAADQWGLVRIGAPGAWSKTVGDERIVVGVVDTGIYLDHVDLRDQLWTTELNRVFVHGRNFATAKPSDGPCYNYAGELRDFPCDSEGHGTDVASVLAASTNNGVGMAGTAQRALLMAVKFIEKCPPGEKEDCGKASDASVAIRFAVDNGARIVNVSWFTNANNRYLRRAIDEAEKQGVLVVAAVDNRLTNNDCVKAYPASYDHSNVIAVGASTSREQVNSAFGHGLMFAPGLAIKVATNDGEYGFEAGTSLAAAYVSGGAVLVWSLAPRWNAAQVKLQLLATADHPNDLNVEGMAFPRLNVDAATAAPVKFSEEAIDSPWIHGTGHLVKWTTSYQSPACPDGDIILVADGADGPRQITSKVPWQRLSTEITPDERFAGKTAKLVARCTETWIAESSPAFTVL